MSKAIFYCDGSCTPNPGYAGYGVFGYVYKEVDKSKNFKHPVHPLYFTENGLLKEKSSVNLEVFQILEVIKSLNSPNSTNNEAELCAVITSLEKALLIPNLTDLTIYTDSNYIVTSFNENINKWKQNNWERIDNKKIVHLNEWLIIDKYITEFKEKNINLKIEWVKGHSDSYCNNIADLYSIIGSNGSIVNAANNKNTTTLLDKVSTYKEFKESYLDKDFIYFFRDLYFSSDKIDDNTYCFLSSSEDPNSIGKRNNVSIFAVNNGYVPDFINKLKTLYRNIERNYVITCCIKLSKLDNKDILRLTNIVDLEYLLRKNNNVYFLVGDNSPFIFECRHNFPFIMSATTIFSNMLSIETYKDYTKIDVTDYFIKDKKVIITNKDKDFDFSELVTNINLKQKLIVSLGYDIPSYLALKNIEKDIEKIYLIIIEEDNYLTIYFNIMTINRNIYSCNIEKKYIFKSK